MKRIDRLPLRLRVILVVALGAVLLIVGRWITDRRASDGGWFGYAPNTTVAYVPGGMRPGVAALIHVALVVVWAGVSFRLLRADGPSPPLRDGSNEETPPGE